MNNPEEVQAVDGSILADIKLGEALTRLEKNKDFKLIIKELFLDGGAINLTRNITAIKEDKQHNVVEQIKARGHLYRFLMELQANADSAKEAMLDMQQEQAEEQ